MKKRLILTVFPILLVFLLVSCSQKTLSGVYETEQSTGSYTSFEFSENGKFVLKTYMLNVKVSHEEGSYEIKDKQLHLDYEDEYKSDVSLPFEDCGEYILINGSEYYKR